MKRQDFQYELPDALIAQRPTNTRDGSRLMHVPIAEEPFIGAFGDIIEAFRGDEVLVLNDTKVVPARITGQKVTGGRIELFFLEDLGNGRIKAMLRGKRLKVGARLLLPGTEAEIIDHLGDGVFEVALASIVELWSWLDAVGAIPLPPYIKRSADASDHDRYQTVFARTPGAVAAPTAGLHMTTEILDALGKKGVRICHVTLHVGLGTFMPMRVDDVHEHEMHTERYVIPNETRIALNSGRPVIAVGTTVVRALESYAMDPAASATSIFIYPGFEFQVVDGLITNFHLPESTLLMMVSAFAGTERIMNAYQAGIDAHMRFFSYGDAMVLKRENGRWT
jgi:S-adenosylmethionine:tRNA ribosyltransferase-isomerase